MSEVIIYADYLSQPCRAVLSFCEICGIPYTFREVRLFRGDYLSEDFAMVSPSKTVPTMTHKGITLYESHAILTYLAREFNVEDSWYPKDLITQSLVNCYLHWHHLHVRMGCGMFLANKFASPILYGKQFLDFEEVALRARTDAFFMLESVLKQGLYVARTKTPTIADISCYCEVISLKVVDFNYSQFPFIQKWMNEIGNIEGVKRVNERFTKMIPRIKL